MITYKKGNILDAETDVLVNTVNSVGVMGKGIALQFKKQFPENFIAYKRAVDKGDLKPGKVFISSVNSTGKVQYIANFATKDHWRQPSRIEWINSGLEDLRKQLKNLPVDSVAIPPLGCGHGGLKWDEVRPLLEDAFKNFDMHVFVFEPSENIKEVLKKEHSQKAVKLTPARAMLLFLLYKYRASGEYVTEFAAEKLSYFLQRAGEKQLKLDFQQGYYGPYSGKVRHVLYAMNGYYLKGFEQKQAKPFEPLEILVDKKPEVETFIDNNLTVTEKERLDKVVKLIRGFETPYGLELLASVDYLLSMGVPQNPSSIERKLYSWSNRKKNMFDKDHIELAVNLLTNSMNE